jgi:hypothetical protein
LKVVLQSAIEFDSAVPIYQRKKLLTQAVFEAAKVGSISKDRLLHYLNRKEKEFLSSDETRYIFVTTLSFSYFAALKRVSFGGVTFTFSRSLPRKFDRSSLLKCRQHFVEIEQQNELVWVRACNRSHPEE